MVVLVLGAESYFFGVGSGGVVFALFVATQLTGTVFV